MTNRITVTEKEIIVYLQNPLWGAWKTFGWEKGIEGIAITSYVLQLSKDKDKKIVVVYKYGCFVSSWLELADFILKKHCYFRTRTGSLLYVFPRTMFKRITKNLTYGIEKRGEKKTGSGRKDI